MANHNLMTTQANAVLEVLQRNGFEPSEFKWSRPPVYRDHGSRLTHTSGASFTFIPQRGGQVGSPSHISQYSPGQKVIKEQAGHNEWNQHLDAVEVWAQALRRELSAPDLWATFEAEQALWDATEPSENNSRFSPGELERIAAGTEEIRRFLIQTVGDDATNRAYIERRLDYLVGASGRLGRIDWANLAANAVVSIVLQLSLPAGAAHELLRMAGQLLSWLTTGHPALPSG
jgi:hypothetical protein